MTSAEILGRILVDVDYQETRRELDRARLIYEATGLRSYRIKARRLELELEAMVMSLSRRLRNGSAS